MSSIQSCAMVDYDQRKPTDPVFGIFFCLQFIAWFAICIYVISTAHWPKVYSITDSDGVMCNNGTVNATTPGPFYPYYYFDQYNLNTPVELLEWLPRGVCVKECPAAKAVTECRVTDLTKKCPTAAEAYVPDKYIPGICVPTSGTTFDALIPNFKKYWPILLFTITMGFQLNLIYIQLLSTCTGAIVKTTAMVCYGLCFCALAAGGGLVYYAQHVQSQVDHAAFMGVGLFIIIISMISIISFTCVYCADKSNLPVAIQIINSTAGFFKVTKRIWWLSLVSFVIRSLLTMFSFVAITAALIQADLPWVGSETIFGLDQFSVNVDIPSFKQIGMRQQAIIGFVFNTWLWIISYNHDWNAFGTMYSASSYYFSSEGDLAVGSAQVMDGVKLASFKHMGSIALGSGIIAIMDILNGILNGMHQGDEGKSGAADVLECIMKSCIACIEGVVEMINRAAYSNMSVSGDKFCKSAYNGFMLGLRHLRTFMLAFILSRLCLNVVSLFIIFMTVGSTYGLTYAFQMTPNDRAFILIGSIIISFIINNTILKQFEDAILATLQCVAIDMDFNGGTPKYGSASFQEGMQIIMDKDTSAGQANYGKVEDQYDQNAQYNQNGGGQYNNQIS